MREGPIPVYLLSGFLGSGKTTLLRRLIDDAKNRGWKPAVLMNEAGDVNLDGLMVDASVPMSELLGGCICCQIRGDASVEVVRLAKEHRPDVIWIESTGLALPMEIIDAVTEASLYERVELRGIVTVVDAPHLLDRVRVGSGKTLRLMREQIQAASLIVLNKRDLVGEPELRELTDVLAEWNPNAEIAPAVKAGIDLERIYEGEPYVRNSKDQSDNGDECGDPNCTHPHAAGDHGHYHHHEPEAGHGHVQALTHYLKGPVDSRAFEAFVGRLPDGVYRAKGIVSFRDTANRYLFQYAYRQSDYMPIRPQGTVLDVVVLIGEGFSRSELAAQLDRLTESQDH
ncbi:CobW family GTP-binding protein [Cohnella caldifontis]|uniref:CobW family GTP-binding protein n=1 Tax=Cohnella caldifontis TaxID=3027471 RepID=UPI0023EDA411|nr:GTP-binding protein [Cohnella sp. YIM B05605]